MNKRGLIFLAIIISLFNSVYSQEWIWSNYLKSDGDVYPGDAIYVDVKTDDNDNIYLTGFYNSSPITIGPYELLNNGNWDGFICKLDTNGSVLWANDLGGSNRDHAVALEIVDNYLFVVGAYKSDPIYFPPAGSLDNFNHYDIFLAKYDLNGNFIKATRIFWGDGADRPRDMIYDEYQNKLVIIGNIKDTIYYNNGITDIKLPSSGKKDLFVAQLDTSGAVSNFVNYKTTGGNSSTFKDINISPDTNYFIGGDLESALYFSVDDSIKEFNGNSDALLIKLDKNLNKVWARKGGGIGNDHANSTITDQIGDVYLTGKVEANIAFDSTETLISDTLEGSGLSDFFLAKYNANGLLQWIKRKGGLGADNGYGIARHENLLQFCGNYSDTIYINNDTLISDGTEGANTGFAIFDLKGNEIGAKSIRGNGTDIGMAITFNSEGKTIIVGNSTSNPLNIGDSSYTNTSGTKDGFIAMYSYPFNANFTHQKNITCAGGSDGELLATTYFGTGPYTYEWSANVTSYIDSFAYNLPADTFSVTITDNLLNQTIISSIITEPEPIDVSLDSVDLTCYLTDDGQINTSVSGGTSPFSFTWSGASGYDINSQNQDSLSAGWYYVTVEDGNECSASDSIKVNQPQPLVFGSVDITPEIPVGSKSGSIDLEPSGGTLPYTFAWVFNYTDSLIGRTEDTLLNLQQGDYTAYITDNNDCSTDTNLIVGGDSLRVVLISSNISCYGENDGMAIARIVSGDEGQGYIFGFKDPNKDSIIADNDTTILNLSNGWYYVTAYEQGGQNRTATDSIEIIEPDTLTLEFNADSVTCYNQSTGAIELNVTGGTKPYSYLWSNSATTESNVNLTAGWYSVSVLDKNLCSAIDSAEVEQPDSISISITLDQSISCYGGGNGIISALVTGGTSGYTYEWDDEYFQTTFKARFLTARDYSLTVYDGNGCSNSSITVLGQPDSLSKASIDTSSISCFGFNDGEFSLTMQGGTPPYSFEWIHSALDTNSFVDLFPGSYQVSISDNNNCEGGSMSFQVKSPPAALSLDEDDNEHTDVLCYGESNGALTLLASGGWGGYNYSLNLTNWQQSPIFSSLLPQVYTISVRDEKGCIVDNEFEILEPDLLLINFQFLNTDNNNLIIIADGGTGTYNYTLNGEISSSSGTFVLSEPDTYFVEVTDEIGCGPIRSNDYELTSSLTDNVAGLNSIFPNPSKGIFNLKFNVESESEIKVEIYSLDGTRVLEEVINTYKNNSNTFTFNLTNYGKGIYIMKINGETLHTKLIVE